MERKKEAEKSTFILYFSNIHMQNSSFIKYYYYDDYYHLLNECREISKRLFVNMIFALVKF